MVFVDTSFWVALLIPAETHHREARTLLERVESRALVTSNHVRGETWTLLLRRLWHEAAVHFLDGVETSSRLKVQFVSERLEAEAIAWLRRHDERPYSFVDATSFALMRSLRIQEALTFDDDFEAAGFVTLRA